ncbi:MAG: SCO family protein [Sulfurifustaceae bacterium]
MIRRCLQWSVALLLAAAVACSPTKPEFKGADITGVDWGGDVRLQAHTGNEVSTADFRGKVLVLFFGYTHCPDICAPTLAKLAAVRKELGSDGNRLQVLFITVDPAHDNAAQLAGFVPKFDPSFIGLTGTPEQLAAVARAHKVAYTPGSDPEQVEHSSGILVKDGNGKLRLLWQNNTSVSDMTHDVRLLLQPTVASK